MTLTREWIEELADWIAKETKSTTTANQLRAHDAAQRATVEELEKECVYWREYQEQLAVARATIEALEKDKERYRLDAEKHYRAATEFEQQLTAMTKERDEAMEHRNATFDQKLMENWVRDTTNLQQQLTAARAESVAAVNLLAEKNRAAQQRVEEIQQAADAIQENNEAAYKHDREELDKVIQEQQTALTACRELIEFADNLCKDIVDGDLEYVIIKAQAKLFIKQAQHALGSRATEAPR